MKYCSDFRYDLKQGMWYEKQLAMILGNKKIEVKTDFQAYRTGNVFIEYASRGKPSGIATTQSEWYALILVNKDEEVERIILMETTKLRGIVLRNLHTRGYKKGGDNDTSRGVLVKVTELVQL